MYQIVRVRMHLRVNTIIVPVCDRCPRGALVLRPVYHHPAQINGIGVGRRKAKNAPVVFRCHMLDVGLSAVFGQQQAVTIREMHRQPVGLQRTGGQPDLVLAVGELGNLYPGGAAIRTFHHLTGTPVVVMSGVDSSGIARFELNIRVFAGAQILPALSAISSTHDSAVGSGKDYLRIRRRHDHVIDHIVL